MGDSESAIGRLNDDCLRHVFEYLTMFDLVNVERVCDRYRHVCAAMWGRFRKLDIREMQAYYNFHKHSVRDHLVGTGNGNERLYRRVAIKTEERDEEDYVGETFRDCEHCKRTVKCETCHVFGRAFAKCRGNLTELSLCLYQKPLYRDSVTATGTLWRKFDCCPRADAHFKNHFGDVRALLLGCANIVTLEICYCIAQCHDIDLSKVFRRNRRIRSLRLIGFDNISGLCLVNLPAELRQLTIVNCGNILEAYLYKALRNLRELRDLLLVPFSGESDRHYVPPLDMGIVCSSLFRSLRRLYISDTHGEDFSLLYRLTSLGCLTLRFTDVTDHDLATVAHNCRGLLALNVSGCSMITSAGLLKLLFLPGLECLDVSYLDSIGRWDAVYLPKTLKALNCSFNEFSDQELATILTPLSSLDVLNLSYCNNLTNDFIDFAVNMAKLNSRGVPLKMCLHSTKVNLDDVTSMPLTFKFINKSEYEIDYRRILRQGK